MYHYLDVKPGQSIRVDGQRLLTITHSEARYPYPHHTTRPSLRTTKAGGCTMREYRRWHCG